MNKSQLFIRAHKLASEYNEQYNNYRLAFSVALRVVHEENRQLKKYKNEVLKSYLHIKNINDTVSGIDFDDIENYVQEDLSNRGVHIDSSVIELVLPSECYQGMDLAS